MSILGICLATSFFFGAEFRLINQDGPGVGLNDPTPVAPIGGNPGTTLGQQRERVLIQAMEWWAAHLQSDVVIEVGASFEPLFCDASSAVLAQAGPAYVVRDAEGLFPRNQTWYPIALGNAYNGDDMIPSGPDVTMTINRQIGAGGCLSGASFYLGLDGANGNQIDLLTIVLHELTHGLGFSFTEDLQTGALFFATPSAWAHHLFDKGQGRFWTQMNNEQRTQSAIAAGQLVWSGPHVAEAFGPVSPSDPMPKMHAPPTLALGSSVSHWAIGEDPYPLMEPAYTRVIHEAGLALPLFRDLGWRASEDVDLSLSLSGGTSEWSFPETKPLSVTLTNDGPAVATGISVSLQWDGAGGLPVPQGDGSFDAAQGLWRLDTLARDETATLTFSVTPQRTGKAAFNAEVLTCSQHDSDSMPGNHLAVEDDQVAMAYAVVQTLASDELIAPLFLEPEEWAFFKIEVPVQQTQLLACMAGGLGDGDLFLQWGTIPSETAFLLSDESLGNGACLYRPSPESGFWYLGILARQRVEDSSLQLSFRQHDLRVTLTDLQRQECPEITMTFEVTDHGLPVDTLDQVTLEEVGNTAVALDTLNSLSPGRFELRYTTPEPHGGMVWPKVTVGVGGNLASATGAFQNCTPEGSALSCWIPEDIRGFSGQSVLVPIWIEPVALGFQIRSFEIELSYHAPWLRWQRLLLKEGVASIFDQVVVNALETGKVVLAGAGTNNLPLVADEASVLAILVFDVDAVVPPGTCVDFLFDRLVFNDGMPLGMGEAGRVCLPESQTVPSADCSVRLLAQAQHIPVGEAFELEIRVDNQGPEVAEELSVVLRSEGLEWTNVSGCGHWFGAEGIWDVGTLFPGEHCTVTLTGIGLTPGIYEIEGEIRSSSLFDPDSTPNNHRDEEDDQDQVLITFTQPLQADLSLSLAPVSLNPREGEWVSLALMIANEGPDPVQQVRVLDRSVSLAPSRWQETQMTGEGHFDLTTGLWTGGPLQPGASQSFTLNQRLTGVSPFTQQFEISASSAWDPDSTPDNRQSSEDDQVELPLAPQFADMALSWLPGPSQYDQNGTITRGLRLHHQSGDSASNLVVRLSASNGSLEVIGNGFDPLTGLWTVTELQPGEMAEVAVEVLCGEEDHLQLMAELMESSQGDPDSVPGNGRRGEDDFDELTLSARVADVSLTLDADHPAPGLGELVVLTLALEQSGPDAVTDLHCALRVPASFSLRTVSGDGQFDPETHLWQLSSLSASEVATLILTLEKTAAGAGEVVAEIMSASSLDPDSVPGNGAPQEDDYASLGLGSVDLALTLATDEPSPQLGELVHLTLTVANEGPDECASFSVSLPLPKGVWVQEVTGEGQWIEPTDRWESATPLASGLERSLVLVVRVFGVDDKELIAEIDSSAYPDPDSQPGNADPSEDDWARLLLDPACAQGAQVSILNADGPGEGFNDPTPRAPVGGNTGTTVGAQRLQAFLFAAELWASALSTTVEVVVEAKFDALTCSANSGVLGAAGPATVARDFIGAPLPATWYPIALANSLGGADLAVGQVDVQAVFNSGIDNNSGCLAQTNWYYGLDGQSGQDIDFVSVLLHEMAHGLGFLSLVDGSSGYLFMGRQDAFSVHLWDEASQKTWPELNDAQRAASARSVDGLVWQGDAVTSSSSGLTQGVNGAGQVQMYAPATYSSGSSVSHFSTSLFPNELMEPSYTGPQHELGLTIPLFQDLGWYCAANQTLMADLSLSGQLLDAMPLVGEALLIDLVLSNDGPNHSGSCVVAVTSPLLSLVEKDSGNGSWDASALLWTLDEVPPGSSKRIRLRGISPTTGQMTLAGEVLASSVPDPDSTPNNQRPSEDDHVQLDFVVRRVRQADLSLNLLTSQIPLEAGEEASLILICHNQGPDVSGEVAIGLDLDPGLVLEEWTSPSQGAQFLNGSWVIANLDTGASASSTIRLSTPENGSFSLAGEIVSAAHEDPDSRPGDGTGDDHVSTSLLWQATEAPCPPCADLTLVFTDPPGQGFWDETEIPVVGGNLGTTLGEQRRIATQHAAERFCAFLQSEVPVKVEVGFADLPCDGESALLAIGQPLSLVRDFPGAPEMSTWYPVALANALSGIDHNGEQAEIGLQLNLNVDVPSGDVSCEEMTVDYQIEQDLPHQLKFEEAMPGLGEDHTYMVDRFVFDAQLPQPSVAVVLKASTQRQSHTFTTPGESHFYASMGFQVTWISSDQERQIFAVEALCNPHALSHILFELSGESVILGAVDALSLQWAGPLVTVERQTCEGIWQDSCDTRAPRTMAGCFGASGWYYGLDGGSTEGIDLVSVVTHELIHGLGVFTTLDLDPQSSQSGQFLLGFPDALAHQVRDEETWISLNAMTPEERLNLAEAQQGPVWSGPEVSSQGNHLVNGLSSKGHVPLFSGSPVVSGLSLNHWSPSLSPYPLMSPFYLGSDLSSLDIAWLWDLGWPRPGCADLSWDWIMTPATGVIGEGVTLSLRLHNEGPEVAHNLVASLQWSSGFSSPSVTGDGTWDEMTQRWSLEQLEPGSYALFQLDTVLTSQEKSLRAEVMAVSESDPDSVPGNGVTSEDDFLALVLGEADLTLSADVSTFAPAPSALVEVNLFLENQGPEPVFGVEVAFPDAPGMVLVDQRGLGDWIEGRETWLTPTLAAGASASRLFVFRASSDSVLRPQVMTSAWIDPDSVPGNDDPTEDDQLTLPFVLHNIETETEVEVEGVLPLDCPEVSVWLSLANQGVGFCCLSVDQFTLREDGVVQPVDLHSGALPGQYELRFISESADGGIHSIDVSVDLGDTLIHTSFLFTQCHEAGCTRLDNQVVAPNISLFQGDGRCFYIDVPPNQALLTVDSFHGLGDVDLFIRHEAEAFASSFDWSSRHPGCEEHLQLSFPEAGRYYILLEARETTLATNLVASFTPIRFGLELLQVQSADCPQVTAKVRLTRQHDPVLALPGDAWRLQEDGQERELAVAEGLFPGEYHLTFITPEPDGGTHNLWITATLSGQQIRTSGAYAHCMEACMPLQNAEVVTPLSGAEGSWRCFTLDVPPGQDVLEAKTWSGVGDSDLYMRYGESPTVDLYDMAILRRGTEETLSVDHPAAGRWYAAIRGALSYSDLSFTMYYRDDELEASLKALDLSACPQVSVEVEVTWNGSALEGLSADAFAVSENARSWMVPEVVNDLGGGRYHLTYVTAFYLAQEVQLRIQITAHDEKALAVSEFDQCTHDGGALRLWVNDDHAAAAGSLLRIPVHLEALHNQFTVGAVGFALDYDPQLLAFVGFDTDQTLMEGWDQVLDLSSGPGHLILEANGSGDQFLLRESQGVLLFLIFEVNPLVSMGSCTDLSFVDGSVRFNQGVPPGLAEDGRFCVQAGCFSAIGDVDRDGDAAEAYDALMILLQLISLPTPFDPIPLCIADTNCNGQIELMDAIHILRRVAYLQQDYCEDAQRSANVNVPVLFLPEQLTVAPGHSIHLSLFLEQLPPTPLFGYQVALAFDDSMLVPTGWGTSADSLTGRWREPTIRKEPSQWRVLHFDALEALSDTGPLVELRFSAGLEEGITQLSFRSWQWAGDGILTAEDRVIPVLIESSWCFDRNQLAEMVAAWPQQSMDVRQLIDWIACLNQP